MLGEDVGDDEQADGEEKIAANRSENLGEIVSTTCSRMVYRGLWGQEDSARVLGCEETTRPGMWRACLLTCAKKAFSQYSWSARTRAIRSGATVLITEEINTVHKTGIRFTKMPVEI